MFPAVCLRTSKENVDTTELLFRSRTNLSAASLVSMTSTIDPVTARVTSGVLCTHDLDKSQACYMSGTGESSIQTDGDPQRVLNAVPRITRRRLQMTDLHGNHDCSYPVSSAAVTCPVPRRPPTMCSIACKSEFHILQKLHIFS